MAGSLNKVQLIGNVGADPEIKNLNNGGSLANIRLATSESWRDKRSGERKEKTEWHTVVVFNEHLVELVDKYVSKGDKIYVEGQLQTRKWEDRDGNDRYSTEVVIPNFGGTITLLSSKNSDRDDDDRGGSRRGNSRSSGRDRDRDDDRGSSRRGGSRSNDRDNDRSRDDDSRSSRRDRSRERDTGSSEGNGGNEDFDDSIPF